MFINHSAKEVTAKIVYYGPGLSGKTTCLQYIFSVTNPNTRGELISIETEVERTLFFDLLPINVGLVKGYQTKFQLYTVPGQIFYDSTRKLVLKGADGIVFVADSQKMMERPNQDSMENLKTNLAGHKLDINEIAMVFQYNKRDLANVFSIEELNRILNPRMFPFFGSTATKGDGVLEALRAISTLILRKIKGLLDQAEGDVSNMPPVNFDINKKHKIIDRENLPFKKIQTDSFEAVSKRMTLKDAVFQPLDGIKNKSTEEELKVETVEEIEELSGYMIDEMPMEPEPLDYQEEIKKDDAKKDKKIEPAELPENIENLGVPEIDENEEDEEDLLGKTVVEADVDALELEEMEKIVEKEYEKEQKRKKQKKEPGIELDNEPFKNLEDIRIDIDDRADITRIDLEEEVQDLGDIGELVEEGEPLPKGEVPQEEDLNKPDETKEAEPFKLAEVADLDINEKPIRELEDIKEVEREIPFKELEDIKEVEKVKEKRELEELKKSLEKKEKNKEKKKIPIIPKGMDLFDQLKDKTRLTVIKEVPVKGTDVHLLIDIKDKDSNLLESVKVKVTPEIKKVTLILDVKK